MATEIVRWCDAHMATDERVPGAAHTVQLDGNAGTVDLCQDHAKVLLGPLVDLMAPDRKGRGGGRPPVEGPARCFLCEVSLRPDRMSPHLRKTHGTGLVEVYGTECPECGAVAATAQSLGSHVRAAHGRDTVVDAWVAVEAAGDPKGVVAARRAGALRGDRHQ